MSFYPTGYNAGSSGGGESYEETETVYPSDSWLSELEVTMSGSPGYLTLEYAAEGKSVDEMADSNNIITEAGEQIAEFIGDQGGFVDNWDVDISFTPFGLGDVRNQASNQLNDVAANIGMSIAALTQGASGLSSGFGGSGFEINPFSETITVPVGGWGSGDKFFSFDPISIPVPEGYSVIERLKEQDGPLAELSVTFGYSGFTSLPWDSSQTTITVEIPPEAFIIETELSGECFNLYPDIATPLEQLPNRVQSRTSGAEDAREQLRSRAEELGDGADVSISSSISQAVSEIQNLSPQDLTGGDFATLKTNIETTDTRINQADEMRDTVESLRDEIETNVGEGCASTFLSDLNAIDDELSQLEDISSEAQELKDVMLDTLENVDSIDCGTAFSSIESQIDNIETDVAVGTDASLSQISLSSDRVNEIQSEVGSIESDIEDEIPTNSPCRSRFLSRTDEIRSRVQEIQDNIISNLGCSDIPNRIRSAANSVESAVQTFIQQDQLARLPDRKDELLDETDSSISTVESEVDDRNPCKRELLSRLRTQQSALQSSGVRPQSAVPCENRYENLGERLDQFEDQVLNISPPITPSDVQDIASQGDEIASMIEDEVPSDDTCRSEMGQRVRSLVERTQTLTARVRVDTEGDSGSDEERQQLIQDLLGSIDQLQNIDTDVSESVEDAVDDADIPST